MTEFATALVMISVLLSMVMVNMQGWRCNSDSNVMKVIWVLCGYYCFVVFEFEGELILYIKVCLHVLESTTAYF